MAVATTSKVINTRFRIWSAIIEGKHFTVKIKAKRFQMKDN